MPPEAMGIRSSYLPRTCPAPMSPAIRMEGGLVMSGAEFTPKTYFYRLRPLAQARECEAPVFGTEIVALASLAVRPHLPELGALPGEVARLAASPAGKTGTRFPALAVWSSVVTS